MSVVISEGMDGYDTLYDHWLEEGSPTRSMERMGEQGGELWRIHVVGGVPIFLLHAAAGPTDPGLTKDPDTWLPTSGYMIEMIDCGMRMEEGRSGHENDFRIRHDRPPLDETVWDPES